MKGSYILLIRVKSPQNIKVGRLGTIRFDPGFYAYVGSALNNLEKRIERHKRSEKKLFWHIDYLLQHANIIEVFRIERTCKLECKIAQNLSQNTQHIPKFGCSDCSCKSHLFYHKDEKLMRKVIEDAIKNDYEK
ncbi:MAG: GIY-YIG nuclease family protein [Candidatus Latescibacteria bacterium]|nr:GIY-YIG nuclease family protein [Candidatus Latescibacterota bacterium]